MNIRKLPLDEQLRRLAAGYTAHPEYPLSIVESIKKVKITSYLAKYKEELARLQELMKLTPDELNGWTYQDLAICIANWYQTVSPLMESVAVMDLLAAPWLTIYNMLQGAQRKGDSQ